MKHVLTLHSLCVHQLVGAAGAPVMTSGNGNTNSSRHDGESKPAQAPVESHILTHLIEGFVIQEGAEPFPVSPRATSRMHTHNVVCGLTTLVQV